MKPGANDELYFGSLRNIKIMISFLFSKVFGFERVPFDLTIYCHTRGFRPYYDDLVIASLQTLTKNVDHFFGYFIVEFVVVSLAMARGRTSIHFSLFVIFFPN